MSVSAEVAALRGIARRLGSATGPIDPRQARAWSSAIQSCVRNLAGAVEHLSAEVAGREPVEPPPVPLGATGYEGLGASEAAARFASVASRLSIEGAPASLLLAERGRFVAAIAAYAPQSAPHGSGVAAHRPDADGTGKARTAARVTSNRAAHAVLPRSGVQRRRVLDAVVQVARNPNIVGLTDVQLAHATGLPANSVRPRRVELVDGGWLEPAQTTREHHGREHTVWVLTQKAVAARELWASPVGASASA
jgi:hypothetical protein